MTSSNRKTLLYALRMRLKEYEHRYQELDEASDRAIVRWRYSASPAFDLRADHFRRINMRQAVPFDVEPTHLSMYFAYGCDKHERIVYIADFRTGESPIRSIFLLHTPEQIELFEYQPIGNQVQWLSCVARLIRSADGTPRYYARMRTHNA